MFTIISFFQKLIKGGVGIRAGGGLENFSKIDKRWGTIIRYSIASVFICPGLLSVRNVKCKTTNLYRVSHKGITF